MWVEIEILSQRQPHYFGWDVQLREHWLLVGAPGNTTSIGMAYLYERQVALGEASGQAHFTLMSEYAPLEGVNYTQMASDNAVADAFGWCVDFDGVSVVIGMPKFEPIENDAVLANTGRVWVLRIDGRPDCEVEPCSVSSSYSAEPSPSQAMASSSPSVSPTQSMSTGSSSNSEVSASVMASGNYIPRLITQFMSSPDIGFGTVVDIDDTLAVTSTFQRYVSNGIHQTLRVQFFWTEELSSSWQTSTSDAVLSVDLGLLDDSEYRLFGLLKLKTPYLFVTIQNEVLLQSVDICYQLLDNAPKHLASSWSEIRRTYNTSIVFTDMDASFAVD